MGDPARPVRLRSTLALPVVPAAMSSLSCDPGDASSRLPVVVASPEDTRSRETASPVHSIVALQYCAIMRLAWLRGFFYIAESFIKKKKKKKKKKYSAVVPLLKKKKKK